MMEQYALSIVSNALRLLIDLSNYNVYYHNKHIHILLLLLNTYENKRTQQQTKQIFHITNTSQNKPLKLVRPRIEYLPQEVIRKIKQYEKRFLVLQRQMKQHCVDYNEGNEPILIIPKITEDALKFNNTQLNPSERSLAMLEFGMNYLLDDGEDGSQDQNNVVDKE
ncbi:Hypothetical_protein [Hexamita inflata]|uniref:Hypothetical_protein n=1 Tax=Hexamita inflata TaxID=28002 RepID=A0AA86R4A6_9EUKA|nr:Hypothetical protein HINF_LOCUS56757 [Hexamita inflata]